MSGGGTTIAVPSPFPATSANPLAPARGGTGISSYAVGDLLYASASTTLSKLAGVATGNALISGGVATAPVWGKIGLTTHVSGILPIANGGTGVANTGTITSAGNITFTGTGTIAIGTFTLTVPATGTVGLLGVANTWTAANVFSNAAAITLSSATGTTLTIDSTDATAALSSAGCIRGLSFRYSTGNLMASVSGDYHLLHTQSGGNGIFLGGAGDPSNYYNNTVHYFRTAASALILTVHAGGFAYTAAAGTDRAFVVQSASVNRWGFGVTATAETGSDAGSNYAVSAFTDSGVFIDYPILCLRVAGGAMTLARPVIATASTTAAATIRLPHGTAPSSPVDGDMWTTTAGLYVRINGATVGPLS